MVKILASAYIAGTMVAFLLGVVTLGTDDESTKIIAEIDILNISGYQSTLNLYEENVLPYDENGTFVSHKYGNEVFFVITINSNIYTQTQ